MNFLDIFSKNTQILNFLPSSVPWNQVVPCGQADTTKLIVAFGNFADAPKGCIEGGHFFVLSKTSQECEPLAATSGSLVFISVGNQTLCSVRSLVLLNTILFYLHEHAWYSRSSVSIVTTLLAGKNLKCTHVQALRLCTGLTAHKESRGITLPFQDHGTRRGGEVSVTPRPLLILRKDPVPIVQETGWAPGPVWTGAENLASTGIRSLDSPARSQQAAGWETEEFGFDSRQNISFSLVPFFGAHAHFNIVDSLSV